MPANLNLRVFTQSGPEADMRRNDAAELSRERGKPE